MAFQRVPNTVEIDIIYLQNFEIVQNTFYARFGGDYAQANLDALADDIDLAIAADWLPIQSQDAAYVRTDVKGLNAINDFVASDGSSGGNGLLIINGMSNNVTLSVKKSSSLSGRSARGRTYWIGAPVTELTGNENFLDAAYVASVVTAVDAVRQAINAAFNWQAVLVSRFTGGAPRDEGETFGWISTSVVNAAVDSQRGRLTR